MTNSFRHRAALLATVGFLAWAAGCGAVEPVETEVTSELPSVNPVIEIASDSDHAVALDGSAPTAQVPFLAGLEMPNTGTLVYAVSDVPATPAEARDLAAALGVDGGVAVISADGRPGWDVPADIADRDRLIVSDSFGPTWDLTRSESFIVDSGVFPCPTVAQDAQGAGGCVGGLEPSAAMPPTDDETDAAVQRLVGHLGLSQADVDVSVEVSGSITNANITFVPSGIATDIWWNLNIASGGVIVFGNGVLRAPQVVMEATLVDIDEVIARFGRLAANIPGQLAPPLTTMPVAPATTSLPIVVDGDIVNTIRPADGVPGPVELPTIDSVQPATLTVYDIANRIWLVPAVRLSDSFGFSVVINAAAAETFRIVEQADVTQVTSPPLTIPGPPATGPIPTVPPPTTTTTVPVPSG